MKDNDDHSSELSRRHTSEEHFHDLKYEDPAYYPSHYRLNPTYVIFQEMKEMIRSVQGEKILEYGCGEGWTTAELLSMGSRIESFDISSVAIEHARKMLERFEGSERCNLKKMAAESLDYPDASFDVIAGFAILHHLDLNKAIPEMYRVLKKGGRAFFAEPLGTNPIINTYRKFTPQFRTADEKPLILKDFINYVSKFNKFVHNEYYLTALFPLGLAYLHVPDRVVNYMNNACQRLDKKILKQFPSMGRFAWYTIIQLEK
jgi:ubiquinone/menaquinone biosynthesis C-methylase UbiE